MTDSAPRRREKAADLDDGAAQSAPRIGKSSDSSPRRSGGKASGASVASVLRHVAQTNLRMWTLRTRPMAAKVASVDDPP